MHQTAVAAARHWEWYGVTPAAAWLPMLPGAWEEEQAIPVAESSGEEAESEASVCLMPDRAGLRSVMDEINAHLDGSLDLNEMMSLILRGMHEGIGLNRILFMLLTRDHAHLKTKYAHGAPPGSPLQQLEVSLRIPNLFSRLLEKMQGVWFSAANAKTLAPLIPPEVHQVIGEGEFFAMSLFVHGKPVGMFYADRKHGECSLDEHSYMEFKKLCVRAADGLAHLARK